MTARSVEARRRRAPARAKAIAVAGRRVRGEVGPFSTDAAICSVLSCSEPSLVAGYCEPHYLRSHRGMDMDMPIRRYHWVPTVYLLPRIRG